jgi:hypothetical protein
MVVGRIISRVTVSTVASVAAMQGDTLAVVEGRRPTPDWITVKGLVVDGGRPQYTGC